ncbi:MAG: hypothetical protein HXN55_07350 [Prevotella nigrescens]|uniref:Uncharacterized protein n=1 Tax=Prevotella nigrescens TaxID=28133 RepID=A0A9D5X0N0_9BACT|nr:hypothetical protein [Prevotella nigrescens]
MIAFVRHCYLHILRKSADLSDFFSHLATKVASIDIMLNNEKKASYCPTSSRQLLFK